MTTYPLLGQALLLLNALWFGAGFQYFSLSSQAAAKLLVPRAHRGSPVFAVLAATGPFLGGFNLAFCALSVLLLSWQSLFPQPQQMALLAAVFAVAHGSQFAANVPMALQAWRGVQPLWVVTRGPMLMIFTLDAALMLANALWAIALLRA